MSLPDFKIPIGDEDAALFWWNEWSERFHQTGDHAFKETAEAMTRYIDDHFDEDT